MIASPALPGATVSVSLPPHFRLARALGRHGPGPRSRLLRRSRFYPFGLAGYVDLEPDEMLRGTAMPTDAWVQSFVRYAKRWWPEALLALLALAVFLGFLGSVELWGKREQRAAAEAIDTVDHNHWLVAQIQGRPRLEKPPLPRWSIAALMKITGCRDEWIVRLPWAIAGVLTVALVYALGRRMRGREIALPHRHWCFVRWDSSSAKCVRPATTLRWRFSRRWLSVPPGDCSKQPGGTRRLGPGLLLRAGSGLLDQGADHLLAGGRDDRSLPGVRTATARLGLRRLASGWGLLIFVALASSWPIAVLLEDPAAAQVWLLEMSEKTGLSQILEHRRHAPLVADWPAMVLPWTLIALAAVILPFLRQRRIEHGTRSCWRASKPRRSCPFLWFAWWWGVGNLAVFCFWSVAKPNYYVPCLPGHGLVDRLDLG